jgi:hypothetical protein
LPTAYDLGYGPEPIGVFMSLWISVAFRAGVEDPHLVDPAREVLPIERAATDRQRPGRSADLREWQR